MLYRNISCLVIRLLLALYFFFPVLNRRVYRPIIMVDMSARRIVLWKVSLDRAACVEAE